MSARRIDVTTGDGVVLRVRDSGGDGIPLLLLHGWSQSQEMFRHQLAGFGARRVISFDMRGHGDSEAPHRGYRIARLAADLRDVIQALGVARVDLLGWSMGASVAWSYLELFGDAGVRSLIVVDQPAAVIAQSWMSERERARAGSILPVDGLVALADAVAGPDGETALRAFVRGMFSGPVDEELWDFVTSEVARTPSHASVPLLIDHGTQDWRDVVRGIRVPTLVIGCEGSHVPPDSQRWLAQSISGARIHVFPREVASSHFPFLENPTAFNTVVDTFLGEVEHGALDSRPMH
jgi:pimeloyl-ACP methyl ester carboxylesterase